MQQKTMKEIDEAYANLVTKNKGRLKISNDSQFLEMLSGSNSDKVYRDMKEYCLKRLNMSARDIPQIEKESILSMALFKAYANFNPDAGAQFLTYLTSKLRGEVSDFRSKRDGMQKKVLKIISNDRESYQYIINPDTEENNLEQIVEETTEDIVIKDDSYFRRMQAFRMAYQGLPRRSKDILTRILDRETMSDIAFDEEVEVDEIKLIRNFALSLILTRVLRSNHLDDSEKDIIREEHSIELSNAA